MRTITRLFDHHSDALDAVRSLEKDGRASDISLVSNNTEQWHTDGSTTDEHGTKAGEGAATGAGVGACWLSRASGRWSPPVGWPQRLRAPWAEPSPAAPQAASSAP